MRPCACGAQLNITKGHAQAFFAYVTWGVFPLYWKYLKHMTSLEILFHRVIWSFAFFFLLIFLSRELRIHKTLQLLKDHFFVMTALTVLICSNWLVYVYAVNSGNILEGSLAYFMTPLINIILGAWLFKEKLSNGMKIASGIAGLGVLVLILLNSQFPWIALTLAFSFATYGVIKKKTKVGGLESSFLENLVMLIPAIIAAAYWRSTQTDSLATNDWFLLAGGGAITALPILLFSISTRAVPLNHTGVLQFIAPTIQFIIGYFIYEESVSAAKLIAFFFVWTGVVLYARELWNNPKISS